MRFWEDNELRRAQAFKGWLQDLVQVRTQPPIQYVAGAEAKRVASQGAGRNGSEEAHGLRLDVLHANVWERREVRGFSDGAFGHCNVFERCPFPPRRQTVLAHAASLSFSSSRRRGRALM